MTGGKFDSQNTEHNNLERSKHIMVMHCKITITITIMCFDPRI
jgi:hypothetical protein